MLLAVASVHCPVCGVDIPCPTATKPTPEGLTVALDTTLVDEHIAMHAACGCVWYPDGRGIAMTATQCAVHDG
jgi:hypothetical protein